MGPVFWHWGDGLEENGNTTGVAFLKTPRLHPVGKGAIACFLRLYRVLSGSS
ncbi:hypothetical protein [Oscillatoria sp. HE19RPO]|uniref:hypothetical protein n=1 Tax=Oscillatoria sp. HE19RPO TaxID=2954806 RepID=UPI0020C50E9C|nr:hypothetical protein [Oscillatoria sp. HE19RPO]